MGFVELSLEGFGDIIPNLDLNFCYKVALIKKYIDMRFR